ncbi:MAG: hypothetical protein HRT90_00730 [Candidatus Margulisbacteria bacterium]|nr:hypothetical protein [Candidatus Margulisiibacteriota bacterium]
MQGIGKTQVMRGGMMAPRQPRHIDQAKGLLLKPGMLRKYLDGVNKNIMEIVKSFHRRSEEAQQKYAEGMAEFTRNPAELTRKFGLASISDFESFYRSITIGTIHIAKEAADMELKLIESVRDQLVKNENACTADIFNKFKTLTDMRLMELDAIEKEIDLEHTAAMNQVKEKSAILKMQIEYEVHQMDVVERQFALDMTRSKTEHEQTLETNKQELESFIKKQEQVLKRDGLTNEHREKILKIKTEKETQIRKIDADLAIEVKKSDTTLEVERTQARRDVEINSTNAQTEKLKAIVGVIGSKIGGGLGDIAKD